MQAEISRFGAWLEAGSVSQAQADTERDLDLNDRDSGLPRLWRAFMAARILVAGVLLLLLLYLRAMGQPPSSLALIICLSYLALTVWVRVLGRPSLPGARFDPQWLATIGVDVLVFSALLYLQLGTINYTPLFALPVLLAAVLAPLPVALGTAATVTLALLLDALQYTLAGAFDTNARYVQAALTSTGLFVVAYLTNQMATRLVRQERAARGSAMAVRAQMQVNQLVIDNLSDGVLVIDVNGVVLAANPAAREMLGPAQPGDAASQISMPQPPFVLAARTLWQPLADLAALSFQQQKACTREVAIAETDGSQRQLHVSTRLSGQLSGHSAVSLCVMFIEDLREMEARVRTEKLAAMGRMSAAVAHEIRNPLSAIAQANALLAEEISAPEQQSLVRMVAQNVQRLSRVVDDVLDVSRAQSAAQNPALVQDAGSFVRKICEDWARQHAAGAVLQCQVPAAPQTVQFEEEHLRRVLVNLLDNALRHVSRNAAAIQVDLLPEPGEGMLLRVWSHGVPIEQGVQRHLFEPFFSSQSRSSGLGLYICRELCQRHGASIGYHRSRRMAVSQTVSEQREGNEFYVLMRLMAPPMQATTPAAMRP